jgi:hypothetical protein
MHLKRTAAGYEGSVQGYKVEIFWAPGGKFALYVLGHRVGVYDDFLTAKNVAVKTITDYETEPEPVDV